MAFFLVVHAGACHAAFAQSNQQPLARSWQRGPISVTTRLSDTAPLAADVLEVEFRVHAPAGIEVELPRLDALPKDFLISGRRVSGPTTDADGRRAWELRFKLEVLAAGSYELPPLEVRYRATGDEAWQSAQSEPITIEFRSLLGDEPDSATPKPNPGPATMPTRPIPWLLISLLLALATAVALAVWFLVRRLPSPAPPRPRVSAYRKAMSAIDHIAAAGWLERGDLDRFYTELSGVVRRYLEDRFGLRAPERTTEEFLQELLVRPVLTTEHRTALAIFLESCDLVKFARARPTVSEGQAVLAAARELVAATRDDSVMVPV
jgi:hypothetical protein